MLHSICQQIWKTQQWPHDCKRSVFITIPKKGNAKEYSNYCTVALTSHACKIMLKILQARLQQYVSWEIPDVQAGLSKGRGTRNQIAKIPWIVEKRREFGKNIYLCFIDYMKHCRSQQTVEYSYKGREYQTTHCQGPAPVDPGNSKRGRRWWGKSYLFRNIRLD